MSFPTLPEDSAGIRTWVLWGIIMSHFPFAYHFSWEALKFLPFSLKRETSTHSCCTCHHRQTFTQSFWSYSPVALWCCGFGIVCPIPYPMQSWDRELGPDEDWEICTLKINTSSWGLCSMSLTLDFLILPIIASATGGQCHALLFIAYHLIEFVFTCTEPSLLLLQVRLQCDWHHVVNN